MPFAVALPAATVMTALIADTMEYAAASRASATQRQYASNWSFFEAFCDKQGLTPLPTGPRVAAVYLSALAKDGKSTSTVESHLAAIKYFNERAQHSINWNDPVINAVSAGIRRLSRRKVEKADAISPDQLATLIQATGTGIAGLRDKAILLIGFAGAFRRSEITALTVANIEYAQEGAIVLLERSKTDQEGEGAEVCIPYGTNPAMCPVAALQAWLAAAGIVSGAVFRKISRGGTVGSEALSEESVRAIMAKVVRASGLEGEGRFSPHSLRAGFCTAAALNGASLSQIARHARHASIQTTQGYVRVAERFQNHAGTGML